MVQRKRYTPQLFISLHMQSLPLENESFITLEKEFKVWLSALGYAFSTVKSAPLNIRELLFFLEQHKIKNIKEVSREDIKSPFLPISPEGSTKIQVAV